jgi:hypothetical protein
MDLQQFRLLVNIYISHFGRVLNLYHLEYLRDQDTQMEEAFVISNDIHLGIFA